MPAQYNPIQPVFLGETEIRYMDTGDFPSIGKYSVALFLQRTPKLNMLITYKSNCNQESLYVATMAIASRLQHCSIDFEDLSAATFFIGEWCGRMGSTSITIPPKDVLITLDGTRETNNASNIIGKMVNAVVSHCMLISAMYYGDHHSELDDALVTIHGLSAKDVIRFGEEVATYATIVVNDISEVVTMENPFSIVFYYVHACDNEHVWDEHFSPDVIQKYATKFEIEIKQINSSIANSAVIKNFTNKSGVENEVTKKMVLQITQFAMYLLNFHIIQQVGGSVYNGQIPLGSFHGQQFGSFGTTPFSL